VVARLKFKSAAESRYAPDGSLRDVTGPIRAPLTASGLIFLLTGPIGPKRISLRAILCRAIAIRSFREQPAKVRYEYLNSTVARLTLPSQTRLHATAPPAENKRAEISFNNRRGQPSAVDGGHS